MTDLPTHIFAWLEPDKGCAGGWNVDPTMKNVSYVRRDMIGRELRAERIGALLDVEAAIQKRIAQYSEYGGNGWAKMGCEVILTDLHQILLRGKDG